MSIEYDKPFHSRLLHRFGAWISFFKFGDGERAESVGALGGNGGRCRRRFDW